MKKAAIILLLGVFLSGCATYKFQQSNLPSDKGYTVSYKGTVIPEYTQGPDKLLPQMPLAKERFKRRRATVEYYYKKMGQIQNGFKEYIWQPVTLFVDFTAGVLGWPFMAVADYKYNHNPKYKEKVDRLDEERDALEKTKLDGLKKKLSEYIKSDLAKEQPGEQVSLAAKEEALPAPVVSAAEPVTAPAINAPAAALEEPSQLPKPAEQIQQPPAPEQAKPSAEEIPVAPIEPVSTVSMPLSQPITPPMEVKEEALPAPLPQIKLAEPKAVIVARPQKGFSPLTVKFSAARSTSANGRIVSYAWDFGDGDSSTMKNPSNTYWSTSYGTKSFTATLTIKDAKGQSASTSVNIDVLTK
ncbi:MAG: PKD domain-containing protein [Candidatus Omnitrophota bacterium]